jgi:hypothetical protein
MNSLRVLSYLILGLVVAACKHPLEIRGQGDIADLTGSGRGCTLEQFQAADTACVDNNVTQGYFPLYGAEPRPGWKFVGWEGPCIPESPAMMCQLATPASLVEWWDETFPELAAPASIAVFELESASPIVTEPFVINSSTQGNQDEPSVSSMPNGNMVATWRDRNAASGDGDGSSIKAQLFGPSGALLGDEIFVNTSVDRGQRQPAVTGLSNSKFAVIWQDENGFGNGDWIKGQVFAASGAPLGDEFVVNSNLNNACYTPAVAGQKNGRFVATWEDIDIQRPDEDGFGGDGSGSSIKAQIFEENGTKVGGEILVNSLTEGHQEAPAIGVLTNDSFVIAWNDPDTFSNGNADGDESGIRAQIFDPEGERIGSEFVVNAGTTNNQHSPSVAALPGDRFVIAWESEPPHSDGRASAIKARVFDSNGNQVVPEFLVNTSIDGNQSHASVGSRGDGSFVVAWSDFDPAGGSSDDANIRMQVFDSGGNKLGAETMVNLETNRTQRKPAATGLAAGGFFIAWEHSHSQGGDGDGSSVKGRFVN